MKPNTFYKLCIELAAHLVVSLRKLSEHANSDITWKLYPQASFISWPDYLFYYCVHIERQRPWTHV